MRYVKCEKCFDDIAGRQKYILYKISQVKGKHRNSTQEAILRLCSKCGNDLYQQKKKWLERKKERDILYPKVLKWYKGYPNVIRHFYENPEDMEKEAEECKDRPEILENWYSQYDSRCVAVYFTPTFEEYMRNVDYNIRWRLDNDINKLNDFFKDDRILASVKSMNQPQKAALDESLRYMETKIRTYADDIKNIRDAVSENLL